MPLLWSLPFTAPGFEFHLQYHDFVITGESGVNEERFLILGAWNVVTRELLVRQELEHKGISYDAHPQVFLALEMPLFTPPQGPPPPPLPPQGPLHHLRPRQHPHLR